MLGHAAKVCGIAHGGHHGLQALGRKTPGPLAYLGHARAGGGYAASSGTSFAVPFAATAVARLRQVDPSENPVEVLRRSAEDLGAPGWDDIYGYGLLRPAS